MKKNKHKIWLYESTNAKDISRFIKYNGDKIVSPNCTLIPVKDIILISTKNVSKNYSMVVTSKGTYYSDLSLIKLAALVDTDLKKISKSCFVSIRKIHSRLFLKYVFLKGVELPIKVGEKYSEKLKQYLNI